MIFGRNTQQIMGLVTAFAGFLGTVVQVLAPQMAGPFGTILTSLVGFLGIAIAVIANTSTTPTSDPQLVNGTMIRVTSQDGRVIAHKAIEVDPNAVVDGNDEEGVA